MNVLQIVPKFELGGVETGILDFARYMKKTGHHPVVISSGGRLVEQLERESIAHYNLNVHKKSLFSILSCIPKVRDIILREKITIVHCRSRVPDIIGFFASLKTPARFIVTAHGCYPVQFYSKIVLLPKFLIVPSMHAARYFVEKFKVNPERIRVIARGSDVDSIAYREPEHKPNVPVIAFIGRLSRVKGIEYLIDAINILVVDNPEIKCLIIGEAGKKQSSYKKYLHRMVSNYGIKNNVEFCGIMDVASVLRDVSVLVLPSVVPETFGRVLVEAMAAGVPCISTDFGGQSEVIEHEKTGLLVPGFDSKAISNAIVRLLGDKQFYCRIAEAGRKKVEHEYRLETMCERTMDVYAELCTPRKDIL